MSVEVSWKVGAAGSESYVLYLKGAEVDIADTFPMERKFLSNKRVKRAIP